MLSPVFSACVAFAPALALSSRAPCGRQRRLPPPPQRNPCGVCASRRASSASASGASGGNFTLPGGFSPAEHSKERIRWADKVALQSQFGSALDTLEVILAALRDNKTREDVGMPGDTRYRDEGLNAFYDFAHFDVWDMRSELFGAPGRDLGQFERFKTVMVLPPFSIVLTAEHRILSVFSPTEDRALIRVLYSKLHSDDAVFRVSLTRVSGSWMIDSFLHDAEWTLAQTLGMKPEDDGTGVLE